MFQTQSHRQMGDDRYIDGEEDKLCYNKITLWLLDAYVKFYPDWRR